MQSIKNSFINISVVFWFSCFLFSPLIGAGHPHVFIDFTPSLNMVDGALHGIDIVWTFDRFTSETIIDDIDKNRNKKIDPDEMPYFNENYRSIEDEANFFLCLYYEKRAFNDYNATLQRVSIENKQILYEIEIRFLQPLNPDDRKTLLIEFSDPEMFVAYTFKEGISNEKKSQKDLRIQFDPLPKRESCFAVEFIPERTVSSSEVQIVSEPVKGKPAMDMASIPIPNDSFFKNLRNWLFSIQGKYNRKLGDLVIDAKENFSFKVGLSLIAFSFLYGILHALGPGHGKSVVVGYFLQRKASPFQVLSTTGTISLIHTGSAVLLAFLFQTILSSYVGFQRIRIQSNFSFLVACFIFFVGLVLLFQMTRKKIRGSNKEYDSNQAMPKWIYAAGVIPCPLSITIMLVSVTQNILFLGLIAVISISLGMLVVLFVAGLIAMIAKSTTYTYSSRRWGIASKLHDGVEFCGVSLIVLFGLGLILLYMPKF